MFPLQDFTPVLSDIPRSFDGCIQDLILGSRTVNLLTDFEQAVNIDNCLIPVCEDVDCNNRGRCAPTVRKHLFKGGLCPGVVTLL